MPEVTLILLNTIQGLLWCPTHCFTLCLNTNIKFQDKLKVNRIKYMLNVHFEKKFFCLKCIYVYKLYIDIKRDHFFQIYTLANCRKSIHSQKIFLKILQK